jgi:alkanesulfonate monooxygenase SsuD/methylene tetrahydromethanopterin reductase-like flavin-dependent oxidoreductase (luciferase family)
MNIVTHAERVAMRGQNALNIGLFGSNCSSGRAVTLVEERWTADWEEILQLAQMADNVGIDFMLPVGRWKGYGGDTDYQGSTYETITWACGLLAQTKRITCFGTVHAPMFNPLIAAKEMVTADHIGRGRFGLNIVCGWNEGEFDMFGIDQRDHDNRYNHAAEWIEVIKRAWGPESDWDFNGRFLKHKGVRAKPKPYGGSRPIIMNAGASPNGREFALKNCDAFFTNADRFSMEATAKKVTWVKEEARGYGREIDVYTVGVVTCRPTKKEAEEYYHYAGTERVDWTAVRDILALKDISPQTVGAEEYERQRKAYANGMGGLPIVGDPDYVAQTLADLSKAGLRGIGISMVNYLRELPYFAQEVLPRLERMGVRAPVKELA